MLGETGFELIRGLKAYLLPSVCRIFSYCIMQNLLWQNLLCLASKPEQPLSTTSIMRFSPIPNHPNVTSHLFLVVTLHSSPSTSETPNKHHHSALTHNPYLLPHFPTGKLIQHCTSLSFHTWCNIHNSLTFNGFPITLGICLASSLLYPSLDGRGKGRVIS
jgi:hypothetical protein